MIELSKLIEGVPYRQRLETVQGHMCDNFYLLKLAIVNLDNDPPKRDLYLFTTKELVSATRRYLYDVENLPCMHRGQVTGYVYPVSYHNRNNILTVRYLCKFSGHEVVELNSNKNVRALFSAREMRRAHDRVRIYITPSVWTKMWKGCKWMVQQMTRHC